MRKKVTVLFFFIVLFLIGCKSSYNQVVEVPFKTVYTCPAFSGGDEYYKRFFNGNLKYPDTSLAEGIEGCVSANWVVNYAGEVTGVRIVQGVDSAIDQTVLKAIKSLPRYAPARANGRPHRLFCAATFDFRMAQAKENAESKDEYLPQPANIFTFPGGEDALKQYVAANTVYPKEQLKQRRKGYVTACFELDKTGKPVNIAIRPSPNKDMEDSVRNMLLSMPYWVPGKARAQSMDFVWELTVFFDYENKLLGKKPKISSEVEVADWKFDNLTIYPETMTEEVNEYMRIYPQLEKIIKIYEPITIIGYPPLKK
ncbi:TonB family protein [Dysgonomonas sp. 25]|uniref:TonB family protein n=1 Tax=Dysgonomonas sp. 25 TaxID=2302933 RepID=UPI0013D19B7E|nr:TonB family protein [Dysgonomonas sp. 25]NDV70194.1 TonB family protein [Dysgonomonas sp. 25]